MAATTNDTKNYLDPKILAKVDRLELRARLIVEGFITGMHKSPYRGFSVEFAQHREYVPGDDIRFVDWKIFGKTDRYFIKEFEEETNLRAYLFVDQSESMTYAHDDGMSKFDYAATAAASLAFMMQQQADAVGLCLFDDEIGRTIPASNTRQNLGNILQSMQDARANRQTRIGSVLQELAGMISKRGLVLLFSDLFDDADQVLRGLRALGQRGHEVMVFHTFDRDELEFPFERMTMFEGLEEMPELLADPSSLRDAYLDEVREFQDRVRRGCLGQRVDYIRLVNDQPLDVALSSYLAARAARAKRHR